VVTNEQPSGPELLPEPAAYPAVSFAVDDLDAGFARPGAPGVRFTVPPMDADGVCMAILDDTCGNLIQRVQLTDAG
jgi:predicted enzyme related to lactoylglutathione lyase